eukprot:CAMPEP_0194176334 /NCGR_PEP_ID=MMETSP0154-20130528/10254_1 /TAXON_ID=1049557 /ORGANISM="Thalassiothrix antarctica, Strain L6-D1" /LENGTH=49 /DNA_ID= /DNA_START= /DNA_END= /DNA_ORIENTATION=
MMTLSETEEEYEINSTKSPTNSNQITFPSGNIPDTAAVLVAPTKAPVFV